ncbi:AAA family ATPase [Ramlibacter sp. WS9]|uniref:AAA family ATPase n=1 Tax=Ramlibacter sp. WS9 TaxID=1882741 RepID=UPI0011418780|nr:AAA family ATPase [Ramlibacter sp. WS9]ROZ78209.1 AAA family ATPase [Ramlibacter sp. WS9]
MQTIVDPALRAVLSERTARLREVAQELKAELFGIDDVIDRVIDSLRAWYVLPQIISRPVIVCLWGLTGTGKTQLTRKLAQKLGFYDRFIEVQMDGFSHGSGYRTAGSVSAMLAESGIEEGEPGILVLDEFQRFRTVDTKGTDIKVERYQDVWALLSDGRLAPSLSFLGEIESTLAWSQYGEDERTDEEKAKKAKFRLSPYEAKELKRSLKLKEPLLEIMAWEPAQLQARIYEFRGQQQTWETDYSKLLVFVAGNLDEMYSEMATRVEDCDTDADIFHELTRKLSLIDVKKALSDRFKPEQIARLGNNHVIYPSFSRATYERLIVSICDRYLAEVTATSGVRFRIDASLLEQIYANAVFPAQGTRPLFSSIHAILSATLVDAALWALEGGVAAGDTGTISFDVARQGLRVRFDGHERFFAANFELNRLKQRANPDFRALLAVHEAGHGLAYGLLFGRPPQEIKINVASFEGGYNSYSALKASSRRNCLDRICVGLSGRAAEHMVFGKAACTTGAEQDLRTATAAAAQFVRHHGFGSRLSRTDVARDPDENLNTGVDATNEEIEALLAQEYARALALLNGHAAVFVKLVDCLVQNGSVPREEVAHLLGLKTGGDLSVLEPYAARLEAFRAGAAALDKVSSTRASAHAGSTSGTSAI